MLKMLQRSALRKAATDAGVDLLKDGEGWIEAASTHAPISAVIVGEQPNIWLGISMTLVAQALGLPLVPAPAGPPSMAAWFALPDLQNLDTTLSRAWDLSRALPNALEQRFEAALKEVSTTEREAAVKQRVGQGLFREGLMVLWGGRCAVTALDAPELLRASHAKPWAASSDSERLDVFNGLLLAAHWDAAFDAGLVTVEVNGTLRLSPLLTPDTLRVLSGKMDLDLVTVKLQPQHSPYLQWHREKVFKVRD